MTDAEDRKVLRDADALLVATRRQEQERRAIATLRAKAADAAATANARAEDAIHRELLALGDELDALSLDTAAGISGNRQ